jgi:aminoglycoside phosphotransferase (APT) family kinase protein
VAVVDFEGLGTGDPALDMTAAWSVFDRPTRNAFRRALAADEQTWLRAANLALRFVAGIRYYEHTNPKFSAMALRAVTEVLDDLTPYGRPA